ncbi:hypothetical protein AG1IA_01126 [Rhizoctonia solani AG-1 IA]|uniref:Uncharacterized protein n=1 Tax=Thanatephorus cucumeris (strain AG1-IA) TaxID=983506 RepID=L8X3S3_THACA|nr:hypothetical protein AG1IA_01126 [Rhizoctonia solani AG-1 IA]
MVRPVISVRNKAYGVQYKLTTYNDFDYYGVCAKVAPPKCSHRFDVIINSTIRLYKPIVKRRVAGMSPPPNIHHNGAARHMKYVRTYLIADTRSGSTLSTPTGTSASCWLKCHCESDFVDENWTQLMAHKHRRSMQQRRKSLRCIQLRSVPGLYELGDSTNSSTCLEY